ncbi:hypothetical protein GCM10029992_34540 [Glycomyces albus]
MADLEFTVPEFNLLLSLVHLRGSGTTTDFRSAFGFEKVEKKHRPGSAIEAWCRSTAVSGRTSTN